MKKLFTILPWFSLFLVLVTLPLSFSSSYTWVSTEQLGSGAGYFVTWLTAIIALILVLIGWICIQTRISLVGGNTNRPFISCISLCLLCGFRFGSLEDPGNFGAWHITGGRGCNPEAYTAKTVD